MDRLIYTALTALSARARQQLVTANNLANAQVPGFRREIVTQEGRYLDARRAADGVWEARAQVGAPSLSTPAVPGQVQATGRALDIAMAANSWMAVQGPVVNGAIREGYTRRGDLSVSAAGLIVNGEGRVVLGAGGGPLSAPPGSQPVVADDGSISVQGPDGPQPAGRIKLVDGRTLSPRDKAGDGLFLPENPLPADPAGRVTSGALESANITAAQALAELVEEQRGFEVNARLLKTAQDMDERSGRLLGLYDQ